jgi:hypothetical protein
MAGKAEKDQKQNKKYFVANIPLCFEATGV